MLDPKTIAYINANLYYGKTYEQIQEELINFGWSPDVANQVLHEYISSYTKNITPTKSKKSKNLRLFVLFILILILVISSGLLVWFVFFQGKEEEIIPKTPNLNNQSKKPSNPIEKPNNTSNNTSESNNTDENCINNFNCFLKDITDKKNSNITYIRTENINGLTFRRNTYFEIVFLDSNAKLTIKNIMERFMPLDSDVLIENESIQRDINLKMLKYDDLSCVCDVGVDLLDLILGEINERYSFVNYEITFKRFDELGISCKGLLYELVKGNYLYG